MPREVLVDRQHGVGQTASAVTVIVAFSRICRSPATAMAIGTFGTLRARAPAEFCGVAFAAPSCPRY